jgi:hypothetical protein
MHLSIQDRIRMLELQNIIFAQTDFVRVVLVLDIVHLLVARARGRLHGQWYASRDSQQNKIKIPIQGTEISDTGGVVSDIRPCIFTAAAQGFKYNHPMPHRMLPTRCAKRKSRHVGRHSEWACAHWLVAILLCPE